MDNLARFLFRSHSNHAILSPALLICLLLYALASQAFCFRLSFRHVDYRDMTETELSFSAEKHMNSALKGNNND